MNPSEGWRVEYDYRSANLPDHVRKGVMAYSVLPLRAIIFQFLFLLLAIALEAIVLYRILNLSYRHSIAYSTSLNLLSTVMGWLLFFGGHSFLPEELERQLLSYIFFERFFPNPWLASVVPILVMTGFVMFIGTFVLEWNGLALINLMLGEKMSSSKPPPDQIEQVAFQRRAKTVAFQVDSTAVAVLIANAFSYSVILFFLLIRWLEQFYQAPV